MSQQITIDKFLSNSQAVIVDVRTPSEYRLGHIPNAVNLPIFSDEERAIVGTLYKQQGRDIAVLRGLEIVGVKLAGFVREANKLAAGGKELYLYCWRGGMRSGSMAWLLTTAGLRVSLLKGGYKSYRSELDIIVEKDWKFVVLSGKTGCGKTDVLKQLAMMGEQVIDLEGLANHKGSAFGALGELEQPTTETFINRIHDRLNELDSNRAVWCEGESMLIGHVYIPQNLYAKIQSATTINFDIAMEARISRLVREYGIFSNEELIPAFERIRKRLGGDNVKLAIEALNSGDISTAASIALRYYDKSYKTSDEHKYLKLYMDSDTPNEAAKKLIELYYKTPTI